MDYYPEAVVEQPRVVQTMALAETAGQGEANFIEVLEDIIIQKQRRLVEAEALNYTVVVLMDLLAVHHLHL